MDTTRTAAARRPRSGTLIALALAGTTALTGLPGASAAGTPRLQTVIVTGVGDVASAVRAVGGQVLDRLPLIGGVSARLPKGSLLGTSWTVVPDRAVGVAATSAATGPASTVRATLGLGAPSGEGAGVTVAVVDTGVANVADLAGRVTHVDVSGAGVGDGYGHGTFVAGLVAGSGASSGGSYAGIAPGARILDVRVADDDGSSDLVTVLKGLQAVAAHPEVDVVNLSLSSGSPLPYQIDPLTVALDALWRKGITVVVPAGNDGADGRGSITSPGIDPVLLTVGGLDENGTSKRRDDTVAAWSSQGPAPQGVAKPDLVAPGSHVISTGAPGSVVWDANSGSRLAGGYMKGSGTSFSTAVMSGAVAVLLADRPQLSPQQVKVLATKSAYDVNGPNRATGSGGLDLTAALDARTPTVKPVKDTIPGAASSWAAFLQALLDGDMAAAASSWAKLSPEARQWAARQWADLSPDARQWAARQWSARQWADQSSGDGQTDNVSADEWAARQWAARQWAARQWADSDWSARQWSARQWSARQWSARQWSDSSWTADDWTARQWSARQWSARQWSTTDWS
jgi:serine protease AprX